MLGRPATNRAASLRWLKHFYYYRGVSSVVEQSAFNRLVEGSNPSRPTKFYNSPIRFIMAQIKYYCLRCETPNSCKCGKTDKQFVYSNKLRPPLTLKNKSKFRKFIDDCPTFVNVVPVYLREDFISLLRKIKYFNKTINGQEWTNIKN